MIDEEISAFWEWFKYVETDLRGAKEVDVIHKELSERLAELGFFDWEIGPFDENSGGGQSHFLSVSINDYDDYGLYFRSLFFEHAPRLDHWQLLNSRPPKAWSRKIIWGRQRVFVDASDWKFSIYRYQDGKYDLVLNTPMPKGIAENEKQPLVVAVLVAELGEILLEQFVNAIEAEIENRAGDRFAISLSEIGETLRG